MNTFSIGQLAQRTQVPIQTIRYYEQRGLLPKPIRRLSGHRQYSEDYIHRVRFIKLAQQLGFSLKEIFELLFLRASPKSTCSDIKKQAQLKITEIQKRITELQKVEKALNELVLSCREQVPKSECPILEFLESGTS